MTFLKTANTVSAGRPGRFALAIWAACTAVVLAAAPAPPFPSIVLGASLFKAAWAYKHDRAWLESQLEWLKAHDFNAIRAFGVVGDPARPDYWDGREIDWRWTDYARVIAGTTDLAHDKYGIRIEWTIFADAQKNIPREQDRSAVVDEFIRIARGREQKILAFEVANEFWQNGFDGPDGIRQLQRFSARLRTKTSIPVAASADGDALCPIYAAGAVDFAPVHFDRAAPAAIWAPLTEPWRTAREKGHLAACQLPRWASNNEPLGPGSSIPQPLTPMNIVMSAVNTYLAGIPIYIFHTGPGVRDDPTHPQGLRPSRLDQIPDAQQFFSGLGAARRYVPNDVVSWRSVTPRDEDFPFAVNGKVAVSLGVVKRERFVVALSGIEGQVELVARRPVRVTRIDPLTGAARETRTIRSQEKMRLTAEAVVLTGSANVP